MGVIMLLPGQSTIPRFNYFHSIGCSFPTIQLKHNLPLFLIIPFPFETIFCFLKIYSTS